MRAHLLEMSRKFNDAEKKEYQKQHLLEQILPSNIAAEMMASDNKYILPEPIEHPNCSIFFSDIVGLLAQAVLYADLKKKTKIIRHSY